MEGEVFKGDVKDVLAELKREVEHCKGMTVGNWLRRRRLERAIAEQYGISAEEFRGGLNRADKR